MAVFVELTTSPIEANFRRVRDGLQPGNNVTARAGRTYARRPLRGLEIKEDTYATLKVIKSDGTDLPLLDSGMPDGYNETGYANFLLQSVQETRMEKHQIIETFGASYVFFFGESPRFLDCTALLINTVDFNWEAEWWANYNTYLRGTKLVEMGARCYLSYDDSVVEGYFMQAQANKAADSPRAVQLQFRFFVTNCFNVSNVGSPMYPIRSSVNLPPSIQLTSKDAGRLLVSNLQREAYGRAEVENFDDRGQIAATTARLQIPGSYRTLSQLVREVPSSVGVSADWWPVLESRGPGNLAGLQNLVYRTGMAIRSLIATNQDEVVGRDEARTQFGYEEGEWPHPPSAEKNIVRTQFESDDLFRQATEFLSCFGADINSPAAYRSLGFQAGFSSGSRAGATFGARTTASFGFSAGTGVGLGAVAGGGFGYGAVAETNTGFAASAYAGYNATAAYQADSLGVVYGARATSDVRFSSTRQRMVQTGFDYSYGYESDYAYGPGYGKAGFGDYGGNGFGSGNSGGDPGFKDPDQFTFAGVADDSSAFERFLRNRDDRTAITRGRVAGRGELSGGASVEVGGRVSAFAVVSVQGELNVFGTAREDAEYISGRIESQKFGFSIDNPFGVSCAKPGYGLGAGLSPGAGVSTDLNFSATAGFSASAGASLSAGARFSAGAKTGVGVSIG